MGKKMIGLIILTVFILSALFIRPAGAASAWYACTVISAGAGSAGQGYVMLTDKGGAFTKRWFLLSSGQENRQLAVCLTALANVKKIFINADISTTVSGTSFSQVNSIYVLNY